MKLEVGTTYLNSKAMTLSVIVHLNGSIVEYTTIYTLTPSCSPHLYNMCHIRTFLESHVKLNKFFKKLYNIA